MSTKPTSGDQCACMGECGKHPMQQCKVQHNALYVDWRGAMRIVRLRFHAGKFVCGWCAHRIAARRAKSSDEPPKQGDLFS